MKKILLILILFFVCKTNFSQPFVTTWNTGTDSFIVIPGYGTNYNIQWEEIGNPSHNGSKTAINLDTVKFGSSGSYKVSISGGSPAFNRINFGLLNFYPFREPKKLLTVEDWGNIQWTSMETAFKNCSNLTSVSPQAPDLTLVTSLSETFFSCVNFNSNISSWNTGNVINMASMFYRATSFNQPIGNWNTSNVTSMGGMFNGASSFNQPIGNWNTSNVINMVYIFYQATSFNQPIDNWNTVNVISMDGMFYDAASFNQPINNWNTSKVTRMWQTFRGALSFNQSLNNWNTSKVTLMSEMFYQAFAFNGLISNWKTDSVIDMSYMFRRASSFNQPIGNWHTDKVKSMQGMFQKATSFNQDISNWNLAGIDNSLTMGIRQMFQGAASFNQPIGSWDVSKIFYFNGMFDSATSFNQNINSWNVTEALDMREMFQNAYSFNQPLSNWNTSRVGIMTSMFLNAQSFNQDISNWNVSKCYYFNGMFYNAFAFNQPIGKWYTLAMYTAENMFAYATSFNQNLTHWYIGNCDKIGLQYSGMQYYNFDSTIFGWTSQNKSNLIINATSLHYCNSINQRANAISTKGWTFIGDSYGCTLPIQITSFSATPQKNKVLLQWQTATETNNNYFAVQRSSNNDNWQDIATIKGAGNSSVAKSYTSTDNNPLQGINYYRIKQTDFNGSVSYSEIRQVSINSKQQTINIYPNPAKDFVNINATEASVLNLYNTTGSIVLQTNLVKGNNTIAVSQLAKGTYFLNICGNNSYKLIKE